MRALVFERFTFGQLIEQWLGHNAVIEIVRRSSQHRRHQTAQHGHQPEGEERDGIDRAGGPVQRIAQKVHILRIDKGKNHHLK